MTRERVRELKKLEKILGVRFRKLALLHQALIHRSYAQSTKADSSQSDNETMEFLGDAVLGLVISDELFREYPVSQVGDLAKVKGEDVTPVSLLEVSLIAKPDQPVKILGFGEVDRSVAVRGCAVSKKAREKIQAAGGRIEA